MTWNKMRSTRDNRWVVKKSPLNPVRFTKTGDKLEPNEWTHNPGKSPFVHIKCETCKRVHSFTIGGDNPTHTVDSNGVINPSLGGSCGFHEWGILEDWEDDK